MTKENKKISDKDLKIIKVINSVYEKNGEIESDKSVEEIETGLSDAGLRVTDKYLKAMLDKSQEMLDAGIGDIEKKDINEALKIVDVKHYPGDITITVREGKAKRYDPYEGKSVWKNIKSAIATWDKDADNLIEWWYDKREGNAPFSLNTSSIQSFCKNYNISKKEFNQIDKDAESALKQYHNVNESNDARGKKAFKFKVSRKSNNNQNVIDEIIYANDYDDAINIINNDNDINWFSSIDDYYESKKVVKESFDANMMPRTKLIDAIDYAYGLFGVFEDEIMDHDSFDNLLAKNNANEKDDDPDEGFYSTMSKEDLINVYNIIRDKIYDRLNRFTFSDIAKDEELLKYFKIKKVWVKESKITKESFDFEEGKDDIIWDSITTRMADCCSNIFGFESEEISEKDWNDLGDILVRIYKKNKSNITEDVEKTFEGPITDKELELSKLIADGIKDEYETIKLYNDIAFIARKHSRDDIAKLIDNINTEENNHVGMLQQALRTISANADAVEDGDKEAFDYLNDDDFKVAANESFEDFLIDDEEEDFIDRTYHDASEDELIRMDAFDNLNDEDDNYQIDESVEEIDDDVSIDITDSKLKEIFDNVNAGKRYGEILNRGKSSRELPWEVLSVSPDKEFIRYRHYGSSSVKNTIEELAWVLQVIFGMKPEEFLSKYELLGSNIDSVDITEDREISTEIDEYQKWVDYDMKKYGKISDITKDMISRAGFEIIKDKYGDYEVTAKNDKSGLADTMKEYQKWVDYDLKKYGMVSNKTQSEIEKAGFKLVKDDHGDYEVID